MVCGTWQGGSGATQGWRNIRKELYMGACFSIYRKSVCLALPAPVSHQTLYLQLEPFKKTLLTPTFWPQSWS